MEMVLHQPHRGVRCHDDLDALRSFNVVLAYSEALGLFGSRKLQCDRENGESLLPGE